MANEWLRMNKGKIDNLQYVLTEMAYKNENPGIPIAEIRGMLGAAAIEIKRLQSEVDILKTTLIQATKHETEPDRNESK